MAKTHVAAAIAAPGEEHDLLVETMAHELIIRTRAPQDQGKPIPPNFLSAARMLANMICALPTAASREELIRVAGEETRRAVQDGSGTEAVISRIRSRRCPSCSSEA